MVKFGKFPDEGELVVGTVKKVEGYGAMVDLEEYPGEEGFIHISEVASGWVKYVRDYVREDQKVVTKVLGVDQSKGHVDLSLKQVNEHQRRETIGRWKNEQKAEKLFEMLAERLGADDVQELYDDFGMELVKDYGGLYPVLEAVAIEEDALTEAGYEGDWMDEFVEIARENISIPFVKIKGYVDLRSYASDGVDHIRSALEASVETEYEDVEIEAQYMGAPHYRLIVQAPDYKAAEDELQEAARRALDVIEDRGGEGGYHRTLEDLQKES